MQTVRTNLTNTASTQYTNFDFTSMCMFNGVILGAGNNGLFKICCGDDDSGTDIDAYFIPYTVDFNNDYHKRVRRVYVGGQFSSSFSLTITGNGNTINGPYETTHNADEVEQVNMFAIDRGSGYKFVYASFKFENINGAFFAVDSVNVLYSTHSRRRRY